MKNSGLGLLKLTSPPRSSWCRTQLQESLWSGYWCPRFYQGRSTSGDENGVEKAGCIFCPTTACKNWTLLTSNCVDGFYQWIARILSTEPPQCRRHRRCKSDPWVRKITQRRKWQSTPVFLPGKSHGQRSPVACSPWGRKESDTIEYTCSQGLE